MARPPTSNGDHVAAMDMDPVSTNINVLEADMVNPVSSWLPFPLDQPDGHDSVLPNEFFLDDSLFNFGDTLTPNFGPIEWYDLLAEDFSRHRGQTQTQSSRWSFDLTSLSRRQSPRQSPAPEAVGVAFDEAEAQTTPPIVTKPWNTEHSIELQPEDVVYFEHFIHVVAPILDLFDPTQQFASVVPHLALRNVGLLKSILAVGACHKALLQSQSPGTEGISPAPLSTPASNSSAPPNTSRIAEQYYYETLQYLSQNLLYQAYTTSHEILATAIMISTYEVDFPGADPYMTCLVNSIFPDVRHNWTLGPQQLGSSFTRRFLDPTYHGQQRRVFRQVASRRMVGVATPGRLGCVPYGSTRVDHTPALDTHV
jgi:hypothetical protein